ncbi:MAG: hypothetical protein U0169_01425 [Polyangiaceae bacterium]
MTEERRSTDERWLSGNGAGLVRARSLATAVQSSLERLYQLDRVADVHAFVEPLGEGEREVLLVRESDGDMELSLRLPVFPAASFDLSEGGDLDALCQLVEGVSHFVYLTDRAHDGREATQLELEVQAEVDKFVMLLAWLARWDLATSRRVRSRLFEEVAFLHDTGSEQGERYRLANETAGRFARRLEERFVGAGRMAEMQRELRRFYRMGQEDKLRAPHLL